VGTASQTFPTSDYRTGHASSTPASVYQRSQSTLMA
jgi:hypothetical protein